MSLRNDIMRFSVLGFRSDLRIELQAPVLKSASEASYDVINMATIIRNCPLIKAIVCVVMVIFIQHERLF